MPRNYKDANGQWWHEFSAERRVRCVERLCETCGKPFPDYRGVRFCSKACAQRSRKSPEVRERVAELYEQGVPVREIAHMTKTAEATVISIARQAGLGTRVVGPEQRQLTAEEAEKARGIYEAGGSLRAVAAALGTNEARASRELYRLGIHAGRRHKDRYVTAEGYAIVFLKPDDPWYESMGGARGRVLEHRLVMAKRLGRPMFDHETVHHKDADRLNNDLSNLELRIGRHGPGATTAHCRTCTCFEDDDG